MTPAAASDPFGSTANPAWYVPRPATERVLQAVELALAQGGSAVAITGPAGLGKTLLLAVLAERLADHFQVVRVPYPALSGAELCRWVLEGLGEPPPVGGDAEGALLDRAFRTSAGGRETLLLVDDASALPPGTARSLATLVSASGGAIRAVLAAGDDARLGAALAALGPSTREVRLDEPMTAEETAAYVRARIAKAGAEPSRATRFDPDVMARIHGATAGVPRRVHDLASLVWRADADSDLARRIERWVREEVGEAEDEAPAEAPALEVDRDGPAVLEVGVDEPAELEAWPEAEAERAPPATGSPDAAAEAAPDTRRGRRRRGIWIALAAAALLIVALPYALPVLEQRLGDVLPDEPTPPPPEAPAASSIRPRAEPAPAPDPIAEGLLDEGMLLEEAPPLEPGDLVGLEPLAEAESAAAPEPEPAPAPSPDAGAASGSAPDAEPARPSGSDAEPALRAEPEVEPEPQRVPGAEPAPEPAPSIEPAPEPTPERAAPPPARAPGIEVEIEATPAALVYVDGGRVGTTPVRALRLTPGLHVIRAEFPDGRAMVRAVEISRENRRIRFTPSPGRVPPVEEAGPAADVTAP